MYVEDNTPFPWMENICQKTHIPDHISSSYVEMFGHLISGLL